MSREGMASTASFLRRAEVAGVLLVLVLMALSWLLVHGLTRAIYDRMAQQGEPPAALGPVGEAGRSQLGPWGYFWSERAFHYRTTLMFAVDDFTSPEVLVRDTAQQYPEGVDAWREYTLLMEPVYGGLYRVFARDGEILAEFLIRLVPLLHVLLLPLIYLLARGLGVRPLLAAGAVLVYATSALGFVRLTGSLLLKEDFALPWLLGFAAAHFHADRRRSPGLLAVAALCLAVALASWHLSQFLALVLTGALAFTAAAQPGPDPGGAEGARGPGRWPVLVPAAYLAAACAAGLTPSLLNRGFFLSLPLMLLAAWLVAAWLQAAGPGPRLTGRLSGAAGRLTVLSGLVLVLGAASFLNRHFTGDYNHIFGLLTSKLVHGLQRPADPGALPFDVRVFWAAPFNSPTWAEMKTKLGWHLLLVGPALAAGAVLAVRSGWDARRRALVLVALAFTLGWLLVERLGVVALPFAVVCLALVAEAGAARPHPFGPRAAGIALAVMTAASVGNLVGGLADPLRVARDVTLGRPARMGASDEVFWGFRGDLLRWLLANTPGPGSRFGGSPAQAVLGDIGVSPQVLLYTGRPVVLNSQFENRPIRRRYQRYLEALFSADPAALRAFLQETGAGYLFIDRTWATAEGAGSAAYLAGYQGPLRLDLNLTRLHFAPAGFDFLQPVYDNEYYRLFKVQAVRQGDRPAWDTGHSNWWNLDRHTVAQGALADLSGDRRRLQDLEEDVAALLAAQNRLLSDLEAQTPPGQPSLAALHQHLAELTLQGLAAGPADPHLADRQLQLEQATRAIQQRLSRRDPVSGQGVGQALAALYTRGPGSERPGWRQLLDSGLAEPSHVAAAGQLAGLLGQYREAAQLFSRAARFFPPAPTVAGDGRSGPVAAPLAQQIRQSAVWYQLAAGNADQARLMAAEAAPFAPPGSGLEKFFRQVAALPSR